MSLPILKVFYKLSKIADVFMQFLIFPANWSVKIKNTKGERENVDFKATKFVFFQWPTKEFFFPKISLNQTLPIENVHLVFAGFKNLICFSWLVDMLHFLSCYFSFLKPVSSVELAATYTPFTKWCSRATPTRRSRLHQVLWNAERLVLLMSDVKATTSLCSLQYAS